MKTKSKVLLTALCAVLLVAASVMGTLAYLASSDTVKNTFTVGDVVIDLWENVADANGNKTEAITHTGNVYEEILPGHDYSKNPTVTVKADSEECYVRMMVTVTYDADADSVLADHKYVEWFDFNNNIWVPSQNVITEKDETNGTISRTYEFRYHTTVAESDTDTVLPALFTNIHIADELTNDELATLDDLEIVVVAHAIQADGFNGADEAWTAFDGQNVPVVYPVPAPSAGTGN